jgi:bilin biosynthesis protein
MGMQLQKNQAVEEQGLELLLYMLKNGNVYGVSNASQALADLGGAAVAPLMHLLRDPDQSARWRAAIALQKLGDPAVPALIIALKEEEWYVRTPAIWALSQIRDGRAVDPLIGLLRDNHECCRWMAAAALRTMGDPKGVEAVRNVIMEEGGNFEEIVNELVEGS